MQIYSLFIRNKQILIILEYVVEDFELFPLHFIVAHFEFSKYFQKKIYIIIIIHRIFLIHDCVYVNLFFDV